MNLRPGLILRSTLIALLLWWASGLFVPTRDATHGSSDTARALRFLERQIEAGAPARMQLLFPEGHLFVVVPTALAEVELGLAAPVGSEARAEARARVAHALELVGSEEGRAPFNPRLDPPYGVFYRGWVAWLKARALALDPGDEALAASLERDGDAIAAALGRARAPYLEAYLSMAWPCDTVVALAALAEHDRLTTPRYTATLAAWRAAVRPTLDPSSGLFPHQVVPGTGEAREGPRGTSTALILAFLPEIDPALAADQYGHFRETFVVTRLGLPGVREYADPADPWLPLINEGDIDAGPLLAGLSLSASTAGLAAAARNGDEELASGFLRAAELAGLRFGLWEKRTLGGALPVADALLTWGAAAPVVEPREHPRRLVFGGRIPALLFTALVVCALLAPEIRATVRRRRS